MKDVAVVDDFYQVADREGPGVRSVWFERDRFRRPLFSIPVWVVIMYCGLVTRSAYAYDQVALPTTRYPVGMTQVECETARLHRERCVEVLRCESEREATKTELKRMQNQVVPRDQWPENAARSAQYL